MSSIVVVDNGGGTCKVGMAGQAQPTRVFPNCSAKAKGERQLLLGDMLLDCKEVSQLTLKRPFDRGYLVNWDLEKDILSRVLRSVLKVNPSQCGLLMTEPLFNFPALQATTEQVVFEEFGFESYYAAPAPHFSRLRAAATDPTSPANRAGAALVVDAGFSFTHVVPYFNGLPLMQGVRRLNIGGKAMTNYLKELVSYRSLNMMDETYLVELIKEELCFVSTDLRADLRLAQAGVRSPHRREFVLPDGVNNLRGYVRDPEAHARAMAEQREKLKGMTAEQRRMVQAQQDQVLLLNNERFMVPELIFHPLDIGLQQAGLPEVVTQAVAAVPPALAPLLYSNVVLSGGLVGIPGFRQRFETELRPLVPDTYPLKVLMPEDPVTCAWEGMSMFGCSPQYRAVAMTKAQYEETGGTAAMMRQYG